MRGCIGTAARAPRVSHGPEAPADGAADEDGITDRAIEGRLKPMRKLFRKEIADRGMG